MHKSRIALFCIDVPHADRERSASFWSAATGFSHRRGTQHDEFTVFDAPANAAMLLQGVGDPTARIHLDIHTDDLAAEVARLTGIGAKVVDEIGGWVVMDDPSGVRFCVVPVASNDPSLDGAMEWN